jgi:ATP-binding cassette, subfamily B, bacterial
VFGRKKHADVIRRLPLSENLSTREINGIASLAREEQHPPGNELVREGEPGHVFYVLLDGQAEIVRGDRRVEIRNPGDFFGEIALIAHGTRTATVRATTRVRALAIRDREFRALLGREPQLQHKIVEAMQSRLP